MIQQFRDGLIIMHLRMLMVRKAHFFISMACATTTPPLHENRLLLAKSFSDDFDSFGKLPSATPPSFSFASFDE
ncbi:hypothetical protein KIN20_033098 [Parelaphostrongylus tenuis]|uniref:Uncharacterized protein n=1 Tax=Parelaphostrongylus tenuis TaxID=148309 RepID=A0AAD5WII5_PARTN|nr:hypothetical protein KIN20_033098 [Parelaphostrongylus tenuis]